MCRRRLCPGGPSPVTPTRLAQGDLSKEIEVVRLGCGAWHLAAVCCACPTDPIVCNKALQRTPLMDRALASILKGVMLKDDVLPLFEARSAVQTSKALQCTHLVEFDHYVVAPQFGYRSATEYYRKSAAGNTMMDIRRPTLFLYAQNDITVPIDVFCPEDYAGNPFLCAVVTRYGSHSMSWLEGVFSLESWQTRVTMEYLSAVLLLKLKEADCAKRV